MHSLPPERLREACEAAGGKIDLSGLQRRWVFPDGTLLPEESNAFLPYVASLLVEKVKSSLGAVEFALHMAGMDGCWATDEQRITAALVALGYCSLEEAKVALGHWTAGTAERSGEEQAREVE